MEERAASEMLRQVFADVTARGAWSAIEEDGVARLAVRQFVDDARATGMRVEDVIVEAVGITGAAASEIGDPQLEQIVRWVVADYFSHEQGDV